MIIGLTGLAGSGKDTVAALLAMRGFIRYAFADELRKEAAEMIPIIRDSHFGRILEGAELKLVREAGWVYDKEVSLAVCNGELTPEMVYEKPTHRLMRQLLQRHGTEFRRAQDPEYWIKKLMATIDLAQAAYEPKQHYCGAQEFSAAISDVRFPNEAQAIRERGGQIWRIVGRGGDAGTAHVSESGQSEIRADMHLLNDGTVYDLALKVAKLTEGLGDLL